MIPTTVQPVVKIRRSPLIKIEKMSVESASIMPKALKKYTRVMTIPNFPTTDMVFGFASKGNGWLFPRTDLAAHPQAIATGHNKIQEMTSTTLTAFCVVEKPSGRICQNWENKK